MESQTRGRFRSFFITASSLSLSGISYLFIFNKSSFSWISEWLRWCPTSSKLLEKAERKMFSYLKSPCDLFFTPIKLGSNSEEYQIRSLIVNKDAKDKDTPLLLLHGFASGVGLWILNIDALCCDRPVYALDILGFGHSSRPSMSKDPVIAEEQFIESIEQWRKQIGLNKFILLGHSMGGFLAASYAIKYPERIEHLILADPWGFPTPDSTVKKIEIPIWAKMMVAILRPFNPLAGLRAAGPWGPKLVQRFRPDIIRKFESIVEDPADVSNYIYHCNAQVPSGEAAFKAMMARFGFANRPMIERISNLRQDISITFIYGTRSWIDSNSGLQTRALRENSFVEIKMIQGAGHHVYADEAKEFNNIVNEICKAAETSTSDKRQSHSRQKIEDSVANLIC